jgi:hypothetical protein
MADPQYHRGGPGSTRIDDAQRGLSCFPAAITSGWPDATRSRLRGVMRALRRTACSAVARGGCSSAIGPTGGATERVAAADVPVSEVWASLLAEREGRVGEVERRDFAFRLRGGGRCDCGCLAASALPVPSGALLLTSRSGAIGSGASGAALVANAAPPAAPAANTPNRAAHATPTFTLVAPATGDSARGSRLRRRARRPVTARTATSTTPAARAPRSAA